MEMAGQLAKITKAERLVVNGQMLVLLEWAAQLRVVIGVFVRPSIRVSGDFELTTAFGSNKFGRRNAKSHMVFIWNGNSSSHLPNGRILIPDFS